MGVATPKQRICQCFGQQILSRDDPHHLIVVIDDAEKPQSQRSEQSVCSLDGGRLVDRVRRRIGVGPQIQPAIAVPLPHLHVRQRRIPRVGPLDGIPLHEGTEPPRSQILLRSVVVLEHVGRSKGPALQQRAQHVPAGRPVERSAADRVDNGEGAVAAALQQIVHHPGALDGAQALDFGGHGLAGDDFVALGNGRDVRFQKGDVLQVNVNVVQAFVEDVAGEARGHERQHERQDVLHVARGLQQNDREGNGHAGHAAEHGGGANEGVGSRIGKGAARVIELVQQVSHEASKGGAREEGRDKESGRDGNAVGDGGQGNVGDKKEKERAGREGAIVTGAGFAKVKELLNGNVGFGENETGDFVVFLAGRAAKGHEGFDEILFLVGPVLHVGGQFGAASPQQRHGKGDDRDQETDEQDFHETFQFGMVDAFHAPKGQVLVGSVEDGPHQASETANDKKKGEFPNGKVGCFSSDAVEITETEEFVQVGLSPETVHVADPKEGGQGGHGTEKGAPVER